MDYKKLGKIDDARVRESSGLAASLRHPGILYTQNDSGGNPSILAIDLKGKVVCELQVQGAKNVDWEAIGVGKSTNGTPVLYIADCGDNSHSRKHIVIYEITEPSSLTKSPLKVDLRHKPFELTYPDGPRDCESMIVDQSKNAGKCYIISKEAGKTTGHVYEAPYASGGKMKKLPGEVGMWLTDAALNPAANLIAARSQDYAYLYSFPSLKPLGGKFQWPHQVQGEGMCFSPDGKLLYLSSEGVDYLISVEVSEFFK